MMPKQDDQDYRQFENPQQNGGYNSYNQTSDYSPQESPRQQSSRLGSNRFGSKISEKEEVFGEREIYFQIDRKYGNTTFKQCSSNQIFKQNNGDGLTRKAITNLKNIQDGNYPKGFTDPEFTLPISKNYFLARICDLYDLEKTTPLFLSNDEEPRAIDVDSCSFVCESGLLNQSYLSTLFITQNVNPAGRYVYFVKRDGQYVIEECDDIIPVDRKTWKPLWGLSYKNPWQLVLLKAWLKECGGWDQMMKAEPFAFLNAFGMPSYRIFNFKKQLQFLKKERIPRQKMAENIKYFSLNNQRAEIVAATYNDRSLQKVGLIPNRAGYTIQPIELKERENNKNQHLYRIRTVLPCNWIGKYTAVSETKLNQKYRDNEINLESSFIMTENEVLEYFNMAYAYPRQLAMTESYHSQNCYSFYSEGIQPLWLQFDISQAGKQGQEDNSGFCGFSIKMNAKPSRYRKYPDLRYIFAKKNTKDEVNRSHLRDDIRGSNLKGNLYSDSTCDKWEYRRIDFLQGYHDSITFYQHVSPGNYILFIKTEEEMEVRLRIDSHLPVSKVQPAQLDNKAKLQFFDSCFFGISQDAGVQASFNKQEFTESITLNNGFQECGYGSIAIKTLERAKHKIGMRIYPEKLKKYGIRIMREYEEFVQQESMDLPKSISMVSEKGVPRVIVMERERDLRQTTIGTVFPPKDTVEFLIIKPVQRHKSTSKTSSKRLKNSNGK